MLLTIQNIQKYFGAELCLRNISCVLDAQDRAGIIGENGAGKTTLIKIITGELYPDDGIVTLAHGATIGYLEQNSVLDPACTVYGEMENAFRSVLDAMDEMKRLERQMAECPGDHMLLERHAQLSAVVDAADGYNMDTQIKKILNGMAFPAPDYQKSVAVLSGGEHTRLCLAKLLLQKPDLLILDEPTNHLDFETMEWLESYLKTYRGAVLVVSHDRYFLDAVCTRIWELAGKTMGIIGFGRIGQAVGRLAKAFGMNVLAFNFSRSEKGKDIAEYVTWEKLLAQADVISLHCPLFPETEGIINRETIAKMKDGVILINTSRGQLIREEDLAEALRSKKVYAAACDVVSTEPIRPDNPLLGCYNSILTPHIAWAPKESRQRLMDIAVDNLRAFMDGKTVNQVNREA